MLNIPKLIFLTEIQCVDFNNVRLKKKKKTDKEFNTVIENTSVHSAISLYEKGSHFQYHAIFPLKFLLI
jgi:hypothetical protein